MYCTNCGSANADDASVCATCGTALNPMRSGDAVIGLPEPLFLHISVARLILLSIASFGIYEAYWVYKNWKYINERGRLGIRPFWRGVFSLFFCHSLLRRIQEDNDARALIEPSFSVQLSWRTSWLGPERLRPAWPASCRESFPRSIFGGFHNY